MSTHTNLIDEGDAALKNDALATHVQNITRAPSSVCEFVDEIDVAPPQRFLARLFGRNPIPPGLRTAYREASGDVAVMDALAQLGGEWMVLRSVPAGADAHEVAHLVIGPAGVFSIAIRHHPGGVIWIDGKVFLVDGERVSHVRDSEWEAVRVTQLLSDAVGVRVAVTPCVVVVGARSLTVARPPRRVAVLTPRDVRAWLKSMPRVNSQEDLKAFRVAASGQPDWNDAESPSLEFAQDIERFRRAQSAVSQARHLRLTWVTGVLVLGWLIAVVGLGGVTTSLLFN
ncbi:hypothetical protein BKA04_000004 [Cryobacterium mesophilum]|uniref:NERD domain-containing protein n=1 Tax=Terrimesophilobacter mesophilus TaxID=433647 RepID=A0A4R8V6I3_9MICO|nr:NERD domain-containing protein [Terrimesophilobacter mesophilus]MBB5631781.1 hypothetical protein [Terrimesophilobacter mesophilus]TFB78701.1 NERD domain-containing protein [Terrimesophilobacter mesophilus]